MWKDLQTNMQGAEGPLIAILVVFLVVMFAAAFVAVVSGRKPGDDD